MSDGSAVLMGSYISSCTASGEEVRPSLQHVRLEKLGVRWGGDCAAYSTRAARDVCGCALLSTCALLVIQWTGGGLYVEGGSAMMTSSQISSCTASAITVCHSRESGA